MRDAPCKAKGVSPSIFFPTKETVPDVQAETERVIATFCKKCRHRAACEDMYREHPGQPGIWAGLPEANRPDTPSCSSCGKAVDPLHPSFRCRTCRRTNPSRTDKSLAREQDRD